MKNIDFSKALLKKIKHDKIKPIPKYLFVTKNILIWIIFVISIFLGALSMSITFDYLIHIDWELARKIGFLKLIYLFIPIFWVLFLIGSSFLSFYNYRHTQSGYKLTFLKIVSINILFSIIFSIFFIIFGFNHFIESKIENLIPKYRQSLVTDGDLRLIQVWQNEDNGLLIGEILSVGESEFQFKDTNNKIWTIYIDKDKTDIKKRVSIKIGEKVKIMGEKINELDFDANVIKPYNGMGYNCTK